MRLLTVLCLLASTATAAANAGRPHEPGTRAGEPGGLRTVTIMHEDLRFDLRALAGAGAARVTATYQLDNAGPAITAPLVFVAGTHLGDLEIRFDGARVSGTTAPIDTVPAAWRVPMTTPAFDGAPLGFAADDAGVVAFSLAILPGKHVLAVDYAVVPAWSKGSSTTRLHQLAYLLAPARDWGGFGALDVTIEVPAGWEVVTQPTLAREHDTLRGTFASLPADWIGITLRAPTTRLHVVLQYLLPALLLLVLAGGFWAARAVGRRRAPEDLRPLWPVSLPVALAWGVAIAISGGYVAIRGSLALPSGEAGARTFAGLPGIALAILVGVLAIPFGMWVAHSASRRRVAT